MQDFTSHTPTDADDVVMRLIAFVGDLHVGYNEARIVGGTRIAKSVGAQAALWVYAFGALFALMWPAIYEVPIPLQLSLIALYVGGLFVVDTLGKRERGARLAWTACTAIVAVILSPVVAGYL